MTGNRGVPNGRLQAVAAQLEETEFGQNADRLITHDLLLREGVEVLNAMLSTRSRVVNEELVVRLVIGMS